MEVDSLDQETVILLPNDFLMVQPKDMTLFTITKSALENASLPMTGIRMKFSMKRKITSKMMTTYFPSFLLMMITYATTFFKPFFFEAALSVNLTTMLVMTTIFISKMESLPPTSDIKMIDIWLILCQIYPFLEVVLLTAMEYRKEDKKKGKKTKKKGGKKRKNVHTTSLMIAPMEENMMEDEGANAEPSNARLRKLLDVFSRFKAPTLKTLGRLPIILISSPVSFCLSFIKSMLPPLRPK